MRGSRIAALALLVLVAVLAGSLLRNRDQQPPQAPGDPKEPVSASSMGPQAADAAERRRAFAQEPGPPAARASRIYHWRVVDQKDHPVATFRFEVQDAEDRDRPTLLRSVATPNGEFAFTEDEAPEGCPLAIHPFGMRGLLTLFLAPDARPDPGTPEAPTSIRLMRRDLPVVTTIRGIVLRGDGTPADRARVDLYTMQAGAQGWAAFVRTDDEGRFEWPFQDDPPSAVDMVLEASETGSGMSRPRTVVRTPHADVVLSEPLVLQSFELHLRAVSVAGDPVPGLPLEGSHAKLWRYVALTDASGEAVCHAPGETFWRLGKDARASWCLLGSDTTHDVERDGLQRTWVCGRAAELHGVIRTRSGEAFAGPAWIEAWDQATGTRRLAEAGTERGTFRLRGLKLGACYVLVARRTMMRDASPLLEVRMESERQSCELWLEDVEAWATVVVEGAGAPLAGPIEVQCRSGHTVLYSVTVDLGEVEELPPMPVGTYTLQAIAPAANSEQFVWHVGLERSAQRIDLHLEPALALAVRLPAGAPWSSMVQALTIVVAQDGLRDRVEVAAGGTARLRALRPGKQVRIELQDALGKVVRAWNGTVPQTAAVLELAHDREAPQFLMR